jgi:hypothetical protein
MDCNDSCGNESSCIQLISVEPIPGPFLICPNDTTIACQAEVDAALMRGYDRQFQRWLYASMSNTVWALLQTCASVTVTFTVVMIAEILLPAVLYSYRFTCNSYLCQ